MSRESFDLTEFQNFIEMLSHGLAVSDISVSAITLERVYSRLIQKVGYEQEKIRQSVYVRLQRTAHFSNNNENETNNNNNNHNNSENHNEIQEEQATSINNRGEQAFNS